MNNNNDLNVHAVEHAGTVGAAPHAVPRWLFVLLWTLIFFAGVLVSNLIIVGGPVILGLLQWLLLKRVIRTLNLIGWGGLSTLGLVVGPVVGLICGIATWGTVLFLKQALKLPVGSGAGGDMGAFADNEAFIAGAIVLYSIRASWSSITRRVGEAWE